MAIKRARYRPKGSGNYGDIVHFETDSKMVKHGTSETAEDILDDYKSHKAETATAHGGLIGNAVKIVNIPVDLTDIEDGSTLVYDEINNKFLASRKNYFYNEGDEVVAWVEGYANRDGEVSKEDDHLYMEVYDTSLSSPARTYVTDTLVDFTDISFLKVDWENIGSETSNNISRLTLAPAEDKLNSPSSDSLMLSNQKNFDRKIDIYDVRTVSGLYHIKVSAYKGSTLTGNSKLKVYKVWGEK